MRVSGVYRFIHFIKEMYRAQGGDGSGHRRGGRRERRQEGSAWGGTEARSGAAE